MARALATILLCIVLTAVGAAGGWFAAGRGADTAGPAEQSPDAAGDGGLSPEALANLGIRIAPLEQRDFTRTLEVQSVLVDRPENHRALTAIFGGLVTAVHVETGRLAAVGDPLVTILRDPIPRPKLELTSPLLVPVSEHVHEAIADLRAARKRLEIAEREIRRLAPFTTGEGELPVVSQGKLAELQYERERATLAVDNAMHELERHGLTEAERESVAGGAPPPANASLWRRVLQVNGLWSEHADRIRTALPTATRDLPWTIAVLGELGALGLADAALADLVASTPAAAERFADVAGLLVEGMPLASVATLVDRTGLDPDIVVRVPTGGPSEWNVHHVDVRAGQRVARGDPLLTLYDGRRMWLRVEPVGREVGAVAAAVQDRAVGHVRPLVPDPTLEGIESTPIRLTRMRTTEDGGRTLAYAELENEPLCEAGAEGCRSWRLRAGTRFLLELPAEHMPDRFVVPPGAITQEGPETIIYVQDGSAFRAVPVKVDYQDDRRVVIAGDGGSLYADDPVVVEGAYALGLALQKKAGGSGGNSHGHSHD